VVTARSHKRAQILHRKKLLSSIARPGYLSLRAIAIAYDVHHIHASMRRLFSDDQLKSKDIDTLKRFLRNRLGGYTVAIKYIEKGNLLFRGVRYQERPSTVDRVSYPPADKITKLGRVNRIGQSIFYCSAAAPAVVFELRAKKGDLIAVSQWEVAEPLWMHNLGYHQDALRRIGTSDIAITQRQALINSIPNESRENANLRRQLSSTFTKDIREGDEYKYKQSIAINELLFDKAEPLRIIPHGPSSSRVAGTVYPALQMRGVADNAAIWPEFVDSSLRIKSVYYVLVEAADEATPSYTFLTLAMSSTFSGNNIIWQDTRLPEIERRRHIALEDGRWVSRDGFNQIYDLH
jgi:hypothetical protein